MSTITQTRTRVRTSRSRSSTRSSGKKLSTSTTGSAHYFPDSVSRVPTNKPPFTIGDIRKSIPADCFHRSLLTSYLYLLADALLVCAFVFGASQIPVWIAEDKFGSNGTMALRGLAWVAYWVLAGCVSTGLWVIGHECGHGGFANSALGNDVPGFLVHSFLLVPYFSWKISHRRHHSNTGNLDADEVFVPAIEKSKVAKESLSYSDPEESLVADLSVSYTVESVSRLFAIIRMLLIGWPAYLISNVTAHGNYSPKRWNSHFNPYSEIFADSERFTIFLSDIGLAVAFTALGFAVKAFGAANVFFYYGVPYLIVNLFLVLITFLQHTDLALPHYNASEWDWLRGALATVDRDYGILNRVFHHITDTHVVHHLFSSMPHYHAERATEAVKPLLADYYLYDDTPIVKATWKIFGRCHAVKQQKDKKGIYWF